MPFLPLSLKETQYLVNMAQIRLNSTNVHRVANKCHWVMWISQRFSETGRFPDCFDPMVYTNEINELKRIAGI